MALHQGPLIFLTDGTTESLSVLPDIASLAKELGAQINTIYVDPTADPRQPARVLADNAIAARIRAAATDGTVIASIYAGPLEQILPTLRLAGGPASSPDQPPSGFAIMRASYRGRLGRLFTDNTHADLLRSGPLPLMVLPASGTFDPLRRILFPADLSPRSDAAFDATVELCRTLAAELHVLHVYGDQLLPEERDQARRAAAKSPRELLRIDQERHVRLIERARRRNVRAVAHTGEGRAHTEIIKYATANNINAIVMPSHGTRTLEDMFFGSTTLRVIRRASVPVLALRGTPAHAQPPFDPVQPRE